MNDVELGLLAKKSKDEEAFRLLSMCNAAVVVDPSAVWEYRDMLIERLKKLGLIHDSREDNEDTGTSKVCPHCGV